ncbi:hypothetical protein Dda_6793 [Drechslerella dactyloides]|uniref:Uncharacterized protein n=1 Tax=Drechslerella dactyloides TaxID=74499 RepID=A0AAD6IUK6_DREDA|nr:hypothetical protein Dda_6793 [Drechslerella dactyloides]
MVWLALSSCLGDSLRSSTRTHGAAPTWRTSQRQRALEREREREATASRRAMFEMVREGHGGAWEVVEMQDMLASRGDDESTFVAFSSPASSPSSTGKLNLSIRIRRLVNINARSSPPSIPALPPPPSPPTVIPVPRLPSTAFHTLTSPCGTSSLPAAPPLLLPPPVAVDVAAPLRISARSANAGTGCNSITPSANVSICRTSPVWRGYTPSDSDAMTATRVLYRLVSARSAWRNASIFVGSAAAGWISPLTSSTAAQPFIPPRDLHPLRGPSHLLATLAFAAFAPPAHTGQLPPPALRHPDHDNPLLLHHPFRRIIPQQRTRKIRRRALLNQQQRAKRLSGMSGEQGIKRCGAGGRRRDAREEGGACALWRGGSCGGGAFVASVLKTTERLRKLMAG